MSSEPHNTSTHTEAERGTLGSYVVGFILSLLFTVIPYYLVTKKTLSGQALLITIIGFAVLQLIIQMVFFLHLGREPKPRWNLLFFVSTLGIILIVVLGSLWIMTHLNYNISPLEMNNELIKDEGIYRE